MLLNLLTCGSTYTTYRGVSSKAFDYSWISCPKLMTHIFCFAECIFCDYFFVGNSGTLLKLLALESGRFFQVS